MLKENSNSSSSESEQQHLIQNGDTPANTHAQENEVHTNENNRENSNRVSVDEVPELDEEILMVLGTDPTKNQIEPFGLRSELKKHWSHQLANGLTEKAKEELRGKHTKADFLIKPQLDAEVKIALQESAQKEIISL
ncbi:hypothetical protein ABEB36_015811 [Hypothenemus hampei]|uniref:Uncharacterized protein n=1 Tax=Hypothenemus hampei TaxID=57062 RepID=A0ABD1DYN6_HYPHA